MKKLYLIGCGMGHPELLTEKAKELIKGCKYLLGTNRLKENLSVLNNEIQVVSVGDLSESIKKAKEEAIGVLLSGDTGFFSLAKKLEKEFSKVMIIEKVVGINCLQYLASKTNLSYESIKIVSLHGRDRSILGAVSYFPKTFVLTGGNHKAHTICQLLVEAGLEQVKVTAGEHLSLEDERIIRGTAAELSKLVFSDLTVLLIENYACVNKDIPFKDSDFKRESVPMTKENIRLISIGKMQIDSKDILWDIGTGTGSMAIEMAKKAYDGMVYGIEKNKLAFDLSLENRNKLGIHNLEIFKGEAEEGIVDFPIPDKVFIGGCGKSLEKIIKIAISKNPKVSICINAITIETLHKGISIMESLDFDVEVIQVLVNKGNKKGSYHLMMSENPVYIITGEKV